MFEYETGTRCSCLMKDTTVQKSHATVPLIRPAGPNLQRMFPVLHAWECCICFITCYFRLKPMSNKQKTCCRRSTNMKDIRICRAICCGGSKSAATYGAADFDLPHHMMRQIKFVCMMYVPMFNVYTYVQCIVKCLYICVMSEHTYVHCTYVHCTYVHCTYVHCTNVHCTYVHCTYVHCTYVHRTYVPPPTKIVMRLRVAPDVLLYTAPASDDIAASIDCMRCKN